MISSQLDSGGRQSRHRLRHVNRLQTLQQQRLPASIRAYILSRMVQKMGNFDQELALPFSSHATIRQYCCIVLKTALSSMIRNSVESNGRTCQPGGSSHLNRIDVEMLQNIV